MKKFLVILFCGCAMALSAQQYIGDMTYGKNEYKLSDVHIKLTSNGELTMYSVKFSPLMPVRVNMIIRGVRLERKPLGVHLSGNNLIPSVKGKPKPERIITQLKGTQTPHLLQFEALMGGQPISFKGHIIAR